ncbi:MAG: flagellin FliC [Deltaproteobacteria bacterium]|nr:flagellin FliC [Deltaproteobacteria bacterium]
MALSIFSNIPSLNTQRQLTKTQNALSANLGRLSSGLRINNAGDDAAGLAISEKLRAQIRSLAQAERNANDGISLLQTAEGAMNEVSGMLTRMRELAIQAANATVGSVERGFINQEFAALRDEITRISTVTNFNGTQLIDGTYSVTQLRFQVGIGGTANDAIMVNLADVRATALGSGAGNQITNRDLTTSNTAVAALATLDAAITDVSVSRASIGAVENRLQVTIANLASSRENLSAATSRIRDVDVAEETAAMTRNNILLQAGVSVLAQANQLPALALQLLK